jgi:hypothetical protein
VLVLNIDGHVGDSVASLVLGSARKLGSLKPSAAQAASSLFEMCRTHWLSLQRGFLPLLP